MVRLSGPLFSQKAQKQLGKSLIYKNKKNRSFLTKYNKPGGNRLFDPSPTQLNKRMIYNLIIANWQVKTDEEKEEWNDLVKNKNLKMSGWNLFYKTALTDLPQYLGLQGYWSFNRIVDGKILDLSGNNNNGNLKPSYPSNAPTLVNSINKKFGKAGSFDGSDDYVTMGNVLNLANFSIEVWLTNKSDGGSGTGIFWKWGSGYPSYGYGLSVYGDRLTSWIGDNVNYVIREAYVMTQNEWQHIVMTYEETGGTNSEIKLYRNGEQVGSWTQTFLMVNTTHPAEIGKGLFSRKIGGLIDEVKVYNRVLLLPEIEKHYQLKFT